MTDQRSLHRHYRVRLVVGVATLVLLAIPAIVHSRAAMHSLVNRPPDWIPDTLPEKQAFNTFAARFDVVDLVMISWPGATLDSPDLQTAAEVLRLISADPENVVRPAPTGGPAPAGGPDPTGADQWRRRIDQGIAAGQITATLTPARRNELSELLSAATVAGRPPLLWVRSGAQTLQGMMSSPANFPRAAAIKRLEGSIVGADGRQTCLLVSVSEAAALERRVLLPLLKSIVAVAIGRDRREIIQVGGIVDGATVDAASIRSIEVFAPPSAVLAAVLCYLCLRSLSLTALITAIAVICEGLVMAMVHYSGTPMNAVLIVLPPLVFVLTISSGIHLSNYYLDALEEFADMTPVLAAQRAMRAGTVPCLLASGTTIVGLGSLMLVRLEPIRVFGAVASIGVLLSLGLLLWCLPGAMVLNRSHRFHVGDHAAAAGRWRRPLTSIAGRGEAILHAMLRRPWPTIVLFAIIVAATASGLGRLETSVNVPRMFLPDSDLRVDNDWFERNVGAIVSGDLLVSFADDQIDPLDQLQIVQAIHRTTLADPRISAVLSAASFIPPVSRSRGLAGSASRTVARELIRDRESSIGKLGFISSGETDRVWRLNFRLPQKSEADYGSDLQRLRAAVAASLAAALTQADVPAAAADGVGVSITGQVAIVQTAQEVMLRDLFRSFLTAFVIVGVVMMFLLRSVIGGLVAMIPNLFPTIIIFGLMGLLRKPLDIGSVMTASVALGIAVDDTIHLLSRFGSRRARGLDRFRAAVGALRQCGWAMTQTTMVCGLSLLVYSISDFVPTNHFAILMFILLTSALLGDVFLLPSLMTSFLGRYLARGVGVDPGATLSRDGVQSPAAMDVRSP